MPNPKPKTEHLPRGTKRQLEALGVEALEPGEASFVVRVRGSESLRETLRGLSPKEIGEVVKAGLELRVRERQ